MPTVNSDVHMMSGLQSAYDSMQSHDTNTLYFCTDTQRYFIGDVEYSRPVQHGTGLPSTYLPPNSLFYNTNTRQLFFSKDGASWQVISSIPSINGVELNGNLTSSELDLEPARLVVNVTNSESDVTEGHSDCTYTEIVSAINEGRDVVCYLNSEYLHFSGYLDLADSYENEYQAFNYFIPTQMINIRVEFSFDNSITVTQQIARASAYSLGGVQATNYNEDNYSSSQIAIDSNYFLHAPKLSINGIELTNSTTLEDLNLKGAEFVVNVTQSGSSYIADKTFEEINAAIDSGSDCICYFPLYTDIIKIPYTGKIGASSIIFEEYLPKGGIFLQINIDNTNAVTFVNDVLFASSNDPGLVCADSDTYDETYSKECKMNHADGKLYCQPTMWSFWD